MAATSTEQDTRVVQYEQSITLIDPWRIREAFGSMVVDHEPETRCA
jgi:hypothetical protein